MHITAPGTKSVRNKYLQTCVFDQKGCVGTVDILAGVILLCCEGCPTHCGMFSNTTGFYPPHASSTSSVVTTKNVTEPRSVTEAGVEYSGPTLRSGNSSASASRVAGTTGKHHCFWLIFVLIFLVEVGFTVLARLVSNSCPQMIYLLQPPNVLGLQA
ncbi:hypothetical protein AAY473_030664 [Plecturocebus cupreus]